MKTKKTESEILYEDALQSAETIYNLALVTAKEGIMEELEPKVKRFVSRKIRNEIENSTDDPEDEEFDNILNDEEPEEELGTEETIDDTEEIINPETEIDVDSIEGDIELDLAAILGDESIAADDTIVEPVIEPEIDAEEEELNIEDEDEELGTEDEVDESAQIEEDEDEELNIEIEDEDGEEINLEALVKEIQTEEGEEDEELGFDVEDDEESVEESRKIPQMNGRTRKTTRRDEGSIKKRLNIALAENTKLKTGITVLKEKVDEYVLVNKKLKLISKTFALNNFSKKEKLKIIEAFDRAQTIKDSVKIFKAVKEGVNKSKTRRITEGGSSRVIGTTRPPVKPIVEQDSGIFKK